MSAIVQEPLYPPYQQPMLDERGHVTRPWLLYFESLNGNVGNILNPVTGVVTRTGNLTANDFVLGNGNGDTKTSGFSVVPPASGGLGATAVPSNGQIPIGNGTTYTPAALTPGAGISVTNNAGSVTIASTYAPILLTTVTIANAAMLTLPTTFVTLIAAPGASNRIILVSADIRVALTGVYTNVDAAAYLSLQWGTAAGNNFSNYIANDATVSPALADATHLLHVNAISTVSLINFSQVNTPTTNQWGNASFVLPSDNANQPLILFMSNGASGNLTGGNAANSVVVRLLTMTVAIP